MRSFFIYFFAMILIFPVFSPRGMCRNPLKSILNLKIETWISCLSENIFVCAVALHLSYMKKPLRLIYVPILTHSIGTYTKTQRYYIADGLLLAAAHGKSGTPAHSTGKQCKIPVALLHLFNGRTIHNLKLYHLIFKTVSFHVCQEHRITH